jgi:hypothetical protein
MAQLGRSVRLSLKGAEDEALAVTARLYDYDDAQGGGRLHGQSIMECFQLSPPLMSVTDDDVTWLLAFQPDGLSLDRFPDGCTVVVTSRGELA